MIQKYYNYTKHFKTRCFSNAQGEFSQARAEIFLASDGLYASTASTSADLVGGGLVCWSHSLSISRRQSSEASPQRVLIAVRRPSLSDSMVPMFTHLLLTGSKILSNVGRLGGLSELVFVTEAALDEPCALPPPPSPSIIVIMITINSKLVILTVDQEIFITRMHIIYYNNEGGLLTINCAFISSVHLNRVLRCETP